MLKFSEYFSVLAKPFLLFLLLPNSCFKPLPDTALIRLMMPLLIILKWQIWSDFILYFMFYCFVYCLLFVFLILCVLFTVYLLRSSKRLQVEISLWLESDTSTILLVFNISIINIKLKWGLCGKCRDLMLIPLKIY